MAGSRQSQQNRQCIRWLHSGGRRYPPVRAVAPLPRETLTSCTGPLHPKQGNLFFHPSYSSQPCLVALQSFNSNGRKEQSYTPSRESRPVLGTLSCFGEIAEGNSVTPLLSTPDRGPLRWRRNRQTKPDRHQRMALRLRLLIPQMRLPQMRHRERLRSLRLNLRLRRRSLPNDRCSPHATGSMRNLLADR